MRLQESCLPSLFHISLVACVCTVEPMCVMKEASMSLDLHWVTQGGDRFLRTEFHWWCRKVLFLEFCQNCFLMSQMQTKCTWNSKVFWKEGWMIGSGYVLVKTRMPPGTAAWRGISLIRTSWVGSSCAYESLGLQHADRHTWRGWDTVDAGSHFTALPESLSPSALWPLDILPPSPQSTGHFIFSSVQDRHSDSNCGRQISVGFRRK